MGPLTLEGLQPGRFRLLSPREVKDLRAAVDRQKNPKSPKPPRRDDHATGDDEE
jgi:hypothetical protein